MPQAIGSFTRVSRGGGIGVNVGVRDPNPPTVVTPPSGPAPAADTAGDDEYPSVTALVFDALSAEAVGMCQKAALEYLPLSGSSVDAGRRVRDRALRPHAAGVYRQPGPRARRRPPRHARRHRVEGDSARGAQRRCATAANSSRRSSRRCRARSRAAKRRPGARRASVRSTCSCGSCRARCGCCRRSTRMDRDQRGFGTTKSLFAILQSLNELPGPQDADLLLGRPAGLAGAPGPSALGGRGRQPLQHHRLRHRRGRAARRSAARPTLAAKSRRPARSGSVSSGPSATTPSSR